MSIKGKEVSFDEFLKLYGEGGLKSFFRVGYKWYNWVGIWEYKYVDSYRRQSSSSGYCPAPDPWFQFNTSGLQSEYFSRPILEPGWYKRPRLQESISIQNLTSLYGDEYSERQKGIFNKIERSKQGIRRVPWKIWVIFLVDLICMYLYCKYL